MVFFNSLKKLLTQVVCTNSLNSEISKLMSQTQYILVNAKLREEALGCTIDGSMSESSRALNSPLVTTEGTFALVNDLRGWSTQLFSRS